MSAPPEAPPKRRWKLRLGAFLLLAIGLTLSHSTGWFSAFGGVPHGKRLERMKRSPNYLGGVFQNPIETSVSMDGRYLETLWAWFSGTEQRRPAEPPEILRPPSDSFDESSPTGLRVTWLGHSTVLVEIEGRRILTDPVWSERSSPSTLVGPRRFHPTPIAIADLPRLDAVVISHDHYDHLDEGSIRQLAASGVPFFVPLGVGAHLEKWGVPELQLRELDWWEEETAGAGKLTLVATPARHFSGRGLFDRNETQWASWVIWGQNKSVFFSGDTGMFPDLAEIGTRYGPFDLTLIEIGAFHENWGSIHLGPRGALDAHELVHGRAMLPIHWGTFNLAFHAWDGPVREAKKLASKRKIRLLTPQVGESVDVGAAKPLAD